MDRALLLLALVPMLVPRLQQEPPAAHVARHKLADNAVYALADGAKSAAVPLRFLANQVRLSATINGRGPFDLVLDTGMPIAGVLLFEGERTNALGLADSGAQVQVAGAGGEGKPANALMASGVGLGLGPLSIRDTRALVMPRPEGFSPAVDGVIGGALFFHYVVRIDLDRRQLVLSDPQGWTPPQGVASVPLFDEGGKVFADVRVAVGAEEPLPARVVVDIGAGHALSLNGTAGGRFDAPASAIRRPLGRGVSGVLSGSAGRVRRVEIGSFAFDGVVVAFPDRAFQHPGGGDFHDGNLGEELLRRFNLTFDYAGKRMLLERSQAFGEPFEIEMAGLAYDWQPDSTLRVRSVLPNSPAAASQVQEGDLLLAIDGTDVRDLGEDGVHKALRTDGAERRLTLRRGAETLERTLRLKRLV